MSFRFSSHDLRLNLFAATLAGFALSLTPAVIPQAFAQGDVHTQNDEPVIFHSIRVKLKDGVDPQALELALDQLHRMGREIPVVESYVVGLDLSDDFDFGATFVLRGLDDYKTYMYSPIHLNVDRIGLPLVSNMESVDITSERDPAIKAQIDEIHRQRYEDMEDISDLVEGLESYQGSGRN